MTISEVNQAVNNANYYVSQMRNTFLGYDTSKANARDLQCFRDLAIIERLIERCGNSIKVRLEREEKERDICKGWRFA